MGGINIKREEKYLIINRLLIAITNVFVFSYLFFRNRISDQFNYNFYMFLILFIIISFIFLIYSFIKTKSIIVKDQLYYYIILMTWYFALLIIFILLYKPIF